MPAGDGSSIWLNAQSLPRHLFGRQMSSCDVVDEWLNSGWPLSCRHQDRCGWAKEVQSINRDLTIGFQKTRPSRPPPSLCLLQNLQCPVTNKNLVSHRGLTCCEVRNNIKLADQTRFTDTIGQPQSDHGGGCYWQRRICRHVMLLHLGQQCLENIYSFLYIVNFAS